MQAAAPELIDLSGETRADARRCTASTATSRTSKAAAAAATGSYRQFATNCLLARRLVERGVRFVNLFHASWDHHSNLDARAGLQLPDGRPAGRRAAQGPQAARPARRDAGRLGLASSAARRWARTAGGFTNVTGRDHHPFAFSHLDGRRRHQGRARSSARPTRSAGTSSRTRSTSTTSTPRILHLFGLDHLKLTYRFQGRDFRLTDVAGKVVTKLLA